MASRFPPFVLSTRRLTNRTRVAPYQNGDQPSNSIHSRYCKKDIDNLGSDNRNNLIPLPGSRDLHSRNVSNYTTKIFSTNGLILYGWEELSLTEIKRLIEKNPHFKESSPKCEDMWRQLSIIGYIHNRQDICDLCDRHELIRTLFNCGNIITY